MPPRKVKKAMIQRHRLGTAIRTRRIALHLTQGKLAEKAERSLNYVGNLERGAQNITFDMLVHIAEALKTTIAELSTSANI